MIKLKRFSDIKSFSDWDQIRDLVKDQYPRMRFEKVRGSETDKSYKVRVTDQRGNNPRIVEVKKNPRKSALDNWTESSRMKVENTIHHGTISDDDRRKIREMKDKKLIKSNKSTDDLTSDNIVNKIDSMISKIPKVLIDSPYGPVFIQLSYGPELSNLSKVDESVLKTAINKSSGLTQELLYALKYGEFDEELPMEEVEDLISKLEDPKNWDDEQISIKKLNNFISEANKFLKSHGSKVTLNPSISDDDKKWLESYPNKYYPIKDKIHSLESKMNHSIDDDEYDKLLNRIEDYKSTLDDAKKKKNELIEKYGRSLVVSIIESSDRYSI